MSAALIAAIATVVWVLIVLFVLAMFRAAALNDRAIERGHQGEGFAPAGSVDLSGEDPRSRERVLAMLLEMTFEHDPAKGRHAATVAHYARELAIAAKSSPAEQAFVHTAALLHGLAEPDFFDAVLMGERELPPGMREIVQRYAARGLRILDELPGMVEVVDIIETYQEHVDGSGRPYGLRGKEIPRGARILAVADRYDTLTAGAFSAGVAASPRVGDQLRQAAGHQLDARLVEIFLTNLVDHRLAEPAPFRPPVARAFETLRHVGPRHN